MLITHKITMALDRRDVTPVIDAVQGDTNTRAVEITLTCHQQPWPIPEGVIGMVRFRKHDGTGGAYDTLPDGTAAVTAKDNVLTAILAPQVLTAAGNAEAQVELISGSERLATFAFGVVVQADPSIGALKSDNYVNLSKLITEEVQKALQTEGSGAVEARLQEIEQEIADLKYVKIDVTSVSVSPSTAEMGSTVNTVTVTWAVNKTPVRQTVNGQSVAANLRTQTLNDQALTGTKAYTVAVTDERDATDSASASVTFMNGVYYGVLDKNAQFDSPSEAILSLTRKLQSSRGVTFTVNAGADEQIMFALPVRYGTPVFSVGGFEGGFSFVTNVDFTNASGYIEQYAVWLSDNFGLGSTTVKVT